MPPDLRVRPNYRCDQSCSEPFPFSVAGRAWQDPAAGPGEGCPRPGRVVGATPRSTGWHSGEGRDGTREKGKELTSQLECVTCGKRHSSLTQEHAIPQWLSRLDGGQVALRIAINPLLNRCTHLANGLLAGANLTVRKVCKDCNNGWMCQLEADVKPAIAQMSSGEQPLPLSNFECKKLALWYIKALAMVDLAQPAEHRIPVQKAGRRRVRDQLAPSGGISLGPPSWPSRPGS